jgi:hypothetical protein
LSSVTFAVQQSESGAERENFRRYIAHRFRGLVDDPATWRRWEANLFIDPSRQRIAKEALAKYQSLTQDEIAAAESVAKPVIEDKLGVVTDFPPVLRLVVILSFWIGYAAIPSLLMALLLRRGVVLMIFGATVVTANGLPASRLRAFWRCLIAWFPFFLGIPAVALIPLVGPIATTLIIFATILILTICSNLRSDRSLQYRLAGTWLVPK